MRTSLWVLFLVMTAVSSYAQHYLSPSLYNRDMNYFNPASLPIDSTSDHYVSVLGKRKFVANDKEIWDKPVTLLANFISRTSSPKGLFSVAYLNDRYSYFSRNGIYGGYIREIPLGRAGLSLSARGVLNVDRIRWGDLTFPVSEEGTSVRFTPDLDFGAEFGVGGFSLGAAVHNILEGKVTIREADAIRNIRAFVFHSAYRFGLGRQVKVSPYILVRLKRNILLDAGLSASLFNRVSLSYTLRVNELRGIYAIEARIMKKLFIGVALDRSPLYPDHNGDLLLRYQF
ncbi:MAG: hypothetical protein ABS46_04370 [Cytophagaceae bacterium SCN 52-12]|nr:MAG: hypothetical protein ABS46_04370 [Cytophagaceae bacterium SCN 52-12]